MAQTAAHLVDHVIPPVPVRRPHPLRDAPAQGGHLGRARPLTKVHAAGDLRPSCRSPEAPARVSRSVCAESPAAAGRHGARRRQRRQAAGCHDRRPRPCRARRRRLLRHPCNVPFPRHLSDCLGETDGAGRRGVPARVPSLWRRHPAHLLHHRARGDGRQEPASFEPEVRKRAMATMALPA